MSSTRTIGLRRTNEDSIKVKIGEGAGTVEIGVKGGLEFQLEKGLLSTIAETKPVQLQPRSRKKKKSNKNLNLNMPFCKMLVPEYSRFRQSCMLCFLFKFLTTRFFSSKRIILLI